MVVHGITATQCYGNVAAAGIDDYRSAFVKTDFNVAAGSVDFYLRTA